MLTRAISVHWSLVRCFMQLRPLTFLKMFCWLPRVQCIWGVNSDWWSQKLILKYPCGVLCDNSHHVGLSISNVIYTYVWYNLIYTSFFIWKPYENHDMLWSFVNTIICLWWGQATSLNGKAVKHRGIVLFQSCTASEPCVCVIEFIYYSKNHPGVLLCGGGSISFGNTGSSIPYIFGVIMSHQGVNFHDVLWIYSRMVPWHLLNGCFWFP